MSKFVIDAVTVITIRADGKVKFSTEFQQTLIDSIKKCAASHTTVHLAAFGESNDTSVAFSVTAKNSYQGLADFTRDLTTRVNALTEHGRDAEILEAVFSKYPDLKSHPRANEIVGAFDMLAAKVTEIAKDTKSTPAQTTPALPKPTTTKSAQTKKDLVIDRDNKLRGKGEGQQSTAPAAATRPVNIPSMDGNIFSDGGKKGTTGA